MKKRHMANRFKQDVVEEKQHSKVKKSRRKKRWLRWLVTVAIAAFAIHLWHASSLTITRVSWHILGDKLNQQQIKQSVATLTQGTFFSVDTAAIEGALKNQNWVGQVSVRRVFPNTLTITVEQLVPIARWNANQLIDSQSHTFVVPLNSIPKNLVWLHGPYGDYQNVLQQYRLFNAILSPIGLTIRHLTMTDRHAWSMVLSTGMLVQLGRQNVLQRIDRFVAFYPQVIAPQLTHVRTVDMRYPDGFAVSLS